VRVSANLSTFHRAGFGLQLNISTNMDATTARYVDVRLDRKKAVLDAYHNALHPKSHGGKSRGGNGGNRKESMGKAERKKSSDLDL
jgi:integrase